MLWQCDGERPGWCAVDIEWANGALWVNPSGFKFRLAESRHSQHGFTSLLWVDMDSPIPAYAKPVQWNNVNGFISAETNTVVLFADDMVYHYVDQFLSFTHMVLPEIETHINYTAIKVPVAGYFSCNSSLFERMQANQQPEESKAGRVKLIYGLFGAHFLVAAIMIVLILIYSATGRNGKAGSAFSSSNSNGPKRVRKGRRSSSSRSDKSGSKSGSGKSASKSKAK